MPLDDGGGAGGNRDRFYFMDVPTMWDMLQHHDSAPHQQALKGWRQSYELVLMHKTQVEKYKDKLITAWPPERSKAAQAYVERLDHLIESLGETFEAAIANYTAYSTAIAAVDDAKRKLAEIQQEHTANAAAIARHTDEVRNAPRAYGKAIAPPPPPSPVADGRQEQLRLQAAGLMTGLSAELATAQMSLTAPKPYAPINRMDSSSDAFDPVGSVSLIPVFPSATGRSMDSTKPSKSRIYSPDLQRTTTAPSDGSVDNRSPARKPSEGPILGGATKPPIPPVTTGPSTPTAIPPNQSFGGTPSLFPPQSSQASASSRNLLPNSSGPVGGTPPKNTTSTPTGARGNTPLHGGVIGGTPPVGGSPPGRTGQLKTQIRGAQRINPTGGMIGESAVTPSGQRRSQLNEQDKNPHHWDPDNPWEVKNGVDPILSPHPAQIINPGATIGDR